MEPQINHEQVGIKLANQLASALYQKAVLETVVEQLQRSQTVSTDTAPPTHPQETKDD